METQQEQEQKVEMETWEIQIQGRAWVWVWDRRENGYVQKAINGAKGKAPKRITMTKEEREYNPEIIPPENAKHDPFQNGTLARVEDGQRVGELTDDAINSYLELETEGAFTEAITDIEYELTHRRLLAFAAQHGRMWQVEALRDLIEERYPVPAAGTQPVVAQMYQEGEFGETRLS